MNLRLLEEYEEQELVSRFPKKRKFDDEHSRNSRDTRKRNKHQRRPQQEREREYA